MDMQQANSCTICLGSLKYPCGRPNACEHTFCFECINGWMKQRSECPLCKRTTKYLIKIEETDLETKVPVKRRTAKQFENELVVRDQLQENGESDETEDITIAYACCRECRRSDNEHLLLLCDGVVGRNADDSSIHCNVAYHSYCLPEKLDHIPDGDWFCPFCAHKPENARNHVDFNKSQHYKSNTVTFSETAEEAGPSGLQRFQKNVSKSRQNSGSPLNEVVSENGGAKMEPIEESSIASSRCAAVDEGGSSDAESQTAETDSSCDSYKTNSEVGDTAEDEEANSETITASSDLLDDMDCECAIESDLEIQDEEDDEVETDDDEDLDAAYTTIPGPRGRLMAGPARGGNQFVRKQSNRPVRYCAKSAPKMGKRRRKQAITGQQHG